MAGPDAPDFGGFNRLILASASFVLFVLGLLVVGLVAFPSDRRSFIFFCTYVVRVRLTRAQTVLAMVCYDGWEPGQLLGENREIARTLFGNVDVISEAARSVVVAVLGARSGKSYLGALRLLHLAVTVDLSQLAPGEVGVALIVAPDLRLARQTLRYVQGALESSALRSLIIGHTADSISLRREDGRAVNIEALPATRGGSSLRGRTLVAALLDEASFFRDADFAVNDVEIFAAISPRVIAAGQVLILSTPWVKAGLLFELFSANFGAPSTCLAAHASTLLMRDRDRHVAMIVERERARDPQNAAREHDAIFVDGTGTLLASADVDAAVEQVTRRPRRSSCYYSMTVDVGLRNDSTFLLVFHIESRKRDDGPPVAQLVVDATVRLSPSFLKRVSIDDVETEIAKLADEYGVGRIFGDLHFFDALAPRLKARGLVYEELSMSAPAQERRATTMAARFSSQSISLVNDPVLIRELKELKIVRRSGGGFSVGAPESKKKHDDAADALLLACEVAVSLPAMGGDIVARTFVSVGEDGLSVDTLWRERRRHANGSVSWHPCGPPTGSAAWVRLRREQREVGLTMPDEPDPFDFPDPIGDGIARGLKD